MQTPIRRDSKPWQLQVWASFGIALTLCAIGLAYLPGQDLDRAFMFMGYLFCLSSVFALSKSVRDAARGALARPPIEQPRAPPLLGRVQQFQHQRLTVPLHWQQLGIQGADRIAVRGQLPRCKEGRKAAPHKPRQ